MAGPVFHLPSVSCALTAPGSGTEGPVCTDRPGEKGPPESQHSWILSEYGDELEMLMGAEEACSLFEDLELLPEREEGSVKAGAGG